MLINSLGWERSELAEVIVELPKSKSKSTTDSFPVSIVDAAGVAQVLQVTSLKTDPWFKTLVASTGGDKQENEENLETRFRISFIANVPPLGFSTYFVLHTCADEKSQQQTNSRNKKDDSNVNENNGNNNHNNNNALDEVSSFREWSWKNGEFIEMTNSQLKVRFLSRTGQLFSLSFGFGDAGSSTKKSTSPSLTSSSLTPSSTTWHLRQHFRRYKSSSQVMFGSGPYVFRTTFW